MLQSQQARVYRVDEFDRSPAGIPFGGILSALVPVRWALLLLFYFIVVASIGTMSGCRQKVDPQRIVIWHQMRVEDRQVMEGQLKGFASDHPGFTVEMIFKETEELRSGFIVAAIAGQGPDLVYGAADAVGPFEVMGIIKPLESFFDKDYLDTFIPQAISFYKGHLYQLPDKLGNHLTLIYNKDLLPNPPTTDVELVEFG
jgi:maltose-binding protein MalE